MGRYLEILNAVKAHLGELRLTESQTRCRQRILARLGYPGAVNLFGALGVGKTVLGWSMAAQGEVTYVPCATDWKAAIESGERPLFLDNAEADRWSTRRLLSQLETAGIDKVVLVTRAPIDDYIFRAELTLTADDLIAVRRSLEELNYRSVDAHYDNLWDLVLHIVREGQ